MLGEYRSLKISQRIEDLRLMLSQFGVDVKTSKSAVLSEATDYIAHLRRQHAQSEAERARILQLLQNAQRGVGTTDGKPSTAPACSAAGGAGIAGGPASTAPSAAATPAPAPTTHPGRTVKPPPTGAQQRTIPFGASATPAAATAASGGVRPMAARFAAIEGMGLCGVDPVSESWMVGDGATAAAATAAVAAATAPTGPDILGAAGAAGVPPQQTDVPGFPGLSVAARGGGEGVVPIQMSPPGLMPAGAVAGAVAAPAAVAPSAVACGGGGGADLDATARALSHVNYDRVFRTVPVPMAIANVNGNLVDCNARLTQVTGFRKEEVLFMTIFDLVADAFLQHTFR